MRSAYWLLGALIIVGALVFIPYFNRNYLFPARAMQQDYATCSLKADGLYGLNAAKWRDEHKYGISSFDRARINYIDSCMISDGWRNSSSGDPLGCGSWCYEPIEKFAKKIYEYRFMHNLL